MNQREKAFENRGMKGKLWLSFQRIDQLLLILSQTTNLDSSKLKVFADDNIKFDENGRKFSKRV